MQYMCTRVCVHLKVQVRTYVCVLLGTCFTLATFCIGKTSSKNRGLQRKCIKKTSAVQEKCA